MQQLISISPFLVMIVVFYFLLIRPQQRKQKERNKMLSSIQKGDKVVTVGGLHGTVAEIQEDTYSVRVAHNVILTFERSAISMRSEKKQAAEKKEPEQIAEETT